MRDVIVQEEIKMEKCSACDEFGRIVVTGLDDGQYSPFCPCPFGERQRDHDEHGDMFNTGRRG